MTPVRKRTAGSYLQIIIYPGRVSDDYPTPFPPLPPPLGVLSSAPSECAIIIAVFFAKVVFFIWFQMTIRWTLPRFRYDQIMKLGWKILLPLSLANILVTGLVILAIQKIKLEIKLQLK